MKLERSVFNQPEFIRAVGTNYVPLKVNVAEDPALARHYGVEQWPTDVILAANGQELYRGASPAETNRYIAVLDQIAAHARVGMPSGGRPPDGRPADQKREQRRSGVRLPAGTEQRFGLFAVHGVSAASQQLSSGRLSTVRRLSLPPTISRLHCQPSTGFRLREFYGPRPNAVGSRCTDGESGRRNRRGSAVCHQPVGWARHTDGPAASRRTASVLHDTLWW